MPVVENDKGGPPIDGSKKLFCSACKVEVYAAPSSFQIAKEYGGLEMVTFLCIECMNFSHLTEVKGPSPLQVAEMAGQIVRERKRREDTN